MSPANCIIKHGFHLTCCHLQIRQKWLPAAGEAALAGAKLQAGRGGRQWHDQDQRPRHQGRLQVSQIWRILFAKFTDLFLQARDAAGRALQHIQMCHLQLKSSLSHFFTIVVLSDNFLHISHFPHLPFIVYSTDNKANAWLCRKWKDIYHLFTMMNKYWLGFDEIAWTRPMIMWHCVL